MNRLIPALIVGLIALPLFTSMTTEAVAAESSPSDALTLVVIDPPAVFKSKASSLGYKVGAPIILETLSLNIVKVGLRKGLSLGAAVSELEKYFPALIIDNSEI